jgi:O-antigen ligase
MTAVERVDDWCEKGILALMLAILVFGPLATGAVRTVEFLILQGLVLAMVGLWIVRIWLTPGYRLLWPPISWAILAFAIYAAIRTSHADLDLVARDELVRILVYTLIFLVIVNNLHRQNHVQWLSWILVFLGMLIAAYAIYQFATNSPNVWHFLRPPQYLGRGSGTYICPNHLAGFLEMLIPIGLAFAVLGRKNHVLRLFLAYAAVVMVVGVVVSLSRGGWIATSLSLLVFAAVVLSKRAHRIPVLLTLVALVLTTSLFAYRSELVQKRVEHALTAGSVENIRSRQWLAIPTANMWLDHLWLGVGPAHFDHRFPAYRPVEIQGRPGRAHNDYLNLLADWGLLGGFIVLAGIGLLGHTTWRTWRYVRREEAEFGARQSNRAAFVLGAAIGLFALAIHSFTDFNLHIPANAILAVTLIALLSSHVRFTSNRFWIRLPALAKALLTLLLIVASAWIGHQGAIRAHEHFWLSRAGSERHITPARIHALERAFAIQPANFETAYALGETFRRLAWQGDTGYQEHARTAITWYQRVVDLNPFDPYARVRLGMCLDWLRQHAAAAPYYQEAIELDPNNHYLANLVGWHYVQTEDWATAKQWFERSIEIKWWANWTADRYLRIVNQRLAAPTTPAPAAGP